MFTKYSQYEFIMFGINKGLYKYIGGGSSRKVFNLNNGYVIKIAKNNAGIEQNKTEVNISEKDMSGRFAKVVQFSRNYKYIIMRKAHKIKDISYIWNYFGVSSKEEFYSLSEMKHLRKKYNLLLEDLNRASSWGIINKKPVIIDYGFTMKVKEKYYN